MHRGVLRRPHLQGEVGFTDAPVRRGRDDAGLGVAGKDRLSNADRSGGGGLGKSRCDGKPGGTVEVKSVVWDSEIVALH